MSLNIFSLRDQPSLCFYFPYIEISGVPVLFYRLANSIVQISNIKIFVIDYENGAIARNLIKHENLILLPFVDGKKISPPENSVLIMQSILPYAIRDELVVQPNTKMLFWNLHPDCLVPYLMPLPFLRNLQNKNFKFYLFLVKLLNQSLITNLQKFVKDSVKKKSLLFMDQANLIKTKKYLFLESLDVVFLPLPALGSKIKRNIFLQDFKTLEFTWVGRLCDFKSYILIYTLRKLCILAEKNKIKIKFSIIGDGAFKKMIGGQIVNTDWFNVEFLGSLSPDLLNKHLLNNTDVMAAMGTSALEGAKLGIPTIVLDISYFPVSSDYKFRWLHETLNFDLGHDMTIDDFEKNNLSLEKILLDVVNDYHILSNKAYNYFKSNHDMEYVINKFLSATQNCELRFSDIPPSILKKSILRQAYYFIKRIKYLFYNFYGI